MARSNVNQKLKGLIFSHYETQFDCAQAAGIPESRLSRILRYRQAPTLAEIEKLAGALNVAPADLFPSMELPE